MCWCAVRFPLTAQICRRWETGSCPDDSGYRSSCHQVCSTGCRKIRLIEGNAKCCHLKKILNLELISERFIIAGRIWKFPNKKCFLVKKIWSTPEDMHWCTILKLCEVFNAPVRTLWTKYFLYFYIKQGYVLGNEKLSNVGTAQYFFWWTSLRILRAIQNHFQQSDLGKSLGSTMSRKDLWFNLKSVKSKANVKNNCYL